MELVVLLVITVFVMTYRFNDGKNVYKFFADSVTKVYNKYAPFSYKEVREKIKELGQSYSTRQYVTQVVIFAVAAFAITYFYFWNIFISIIYAVIAIMFVPYLAYLKYQKLYSEYLFEQIQVYCTNVIMEFNTTQSFVKSLEGVRDSEILENPILDDVKVMIDMSYQNGTIDQSIDYFDEKYPYYMVKNMHQLFMQITNEGAKDSGQSLENMSMDIDALVEGVYRDKMDREEFHKQFLTFGIALFFLVLAVIILLGKENYMELVGQWYVQLILHLVIIINCYFLISGERFYCEDTGAE